MKAYNTPKEELRILGDDGDVLVSITPEKAFIKNLEGGGPSVDVKPLTVTENGTYTAPEGEAYSPVTVNVQGGPSPALQTKTLNLKMTDDIADEYNVGGILVFTKTSYNPNIALPTVPYTSWDDRVCEESFDDVCTYLPIRPVCVLQNYYQSGNARGSAVPFSMFHIMQELPVGVEVLSTRGWTTNIGAIGGIGINGGTEAIRLTDDYAGGQIVIQVDRNF